jgi:hypothetical protein
MSANEPAFPVSTKLQDRGFGHQDGPSTWQFAGMTLRDYFAAKAMPVCLSDTESFPDETWRIGVALEAYKMADAMLKAREAV